MTDTFTSSYYDILGISKEADTGTVRRAYRRRVQVVHPDVVGGSTDEFLRVTEAYETLVDDVRRRTYDRLLQTGVLGPTDPTVEYVRTGGSPDVSAPPFTPVTDVDSANAVLFDAPDAAQEDPRGKPARGGRRGRWRSRISAAGGRSH